MLCMHFIRTSSDIMQKSYVFSSCCIHDSLCPSSIDAPPQMHTLEIRDGLSSMCTSLHVLIIAVKIS